MNTYLLIKWIHILSSVLMVGTGFGSAFFMFFTNRSGSLPAQVVVSKLVVRADWWFTTPAAILQPVSGVALAHMAGWPLSSPWLMSALVLYVVAGACWLPVVRLQLRMARTAQQTLEQGQRKVPVQYEQDARLWERLGYPAFVAMLVVYFLMVYKPALWTA